jgi:hypothetical protein
MKIGFFLYTWRYLQRPGAGLAANHKMEGDEVAECAVTRSSLCDGSCQVPICHQCTLLDK